MSLFDYETPIIHDPYMQKHPQVWYDQDTADDEQKEQLHAMNREVEVRAKHSAVAPSDPRKPPTGARKVNPLEYGNGPFMTHIAVANSVVVSVGKDNKVRIEDDQGTISSATVDLKSGGEAPSRLFLDPMGRHIILTFSQGVSRYIHLRETPTGGKEKDREKAGAPIKHDMTFNLSSQQQVGTKSGLLTKMGNPFSALGGGDDEGKEKMETAAKVLVECVCWDSHNKFESASGTVLLGTKSSGNILSARFDAGGMQNPKTIFSFPSVARANTGSSGKGDESYPPINAIAVELPQERSKKPTVILVAVMDKLYYFVGQGPVESVLAEYNHFGVLPNYKQILLENPLHYVYNSAQCQPTLNLEYLMPEGCHGSRYTPMAVEKGGAGGERSNLLVFNWSYGSVLVQGYVNTDEYASKDAAGAWALHGGVALPTIGEMEPYHKKVDLKERLVAKANANAAKRSALGPDGTRDGTEKGPDDELPSLSLERTCVLVVTNEMNMAHVLCLEDSHEQTHGAVVTTSVSRTVRKVLNIHASPLFVIVSNEEKMVMLSLSAGLRWFPANHGNPHAGGVSGQESKEQIQKKEQVGIPGLRAIDVQNRLIYDRTLQRTADYRKDGASGVGACYDTKRRKFAVFTPSEVEYLGDFKIATGLVPLVITEGERAFREQAHLTNSAGVITVSTQELVDQTRGRLSLPARDYFTMSRAMAGKSKRLLTIIDQSLSRALWTSKQYYEAAHSFSRCVTSVGIDSMIVQLSSLNTTTQPLQAYIRNRLNDFLARKVHVDEYVVELAALSTLHIHLLVDQCSRDELEMLARNRIQSEAVRGGIAAPLVPHMGNVTHFYSDTNASTAAGQAADLYCDQERGSVSRKVATSDGRFLVQQQSFGGTMLQSDLAVSFDTVDPHSGETTHHHAQHHHHSTERARSPSPDMVDHFGASRAFLAAAEEQRELDERMGGDVGDINNGGFGKPRGMSFIHNNAMSETAGDDAASGGAGNHDKDGGDMLTLRTPADELDFILQKLQDHVQWEAIQKGVLSIGNQQQINTICTTQRKLDEVLESHILRNCYYDAVCLLINECNSGTQHVELWKRYAFVLVRHFPVKFIRHGWVPFGRDIGLNAVDVLAPLCYYRPQDNEREFVNPSTGEQEGEQTAEHMGIEYLNSAIAEGDSDESVHNLLVLFLARQPVDLTQGGTGDQAFVRFLQGSRYYDKLFAVRAAAQHKRYHALGELYFQLGEAELGIQTALHSIPQREKGVDVAKSLVNRVGEDYIVFEAMNREESLAAARKLRVELWRQIIAFVARREGGSRNALLLVGESHDEVNVSDVLPHFSDDVMIVEFKEELKNNVKKFQHHMSSVDEGISASNSAAMELHKDLNRAKDSVAKVSSTKKCEYCNQTALSRGMMVFGTCGHCLHAKCHNALVHGALSTRNSKIFGSPDTPGPLSPSDRRKSRSGFALTGNIDPNNNNSNEAGCPLCSSDCISHMLTSPLQTSEVSKALRL